MIEALTERKSITDSERKDHCPSEFMEPPYTERYVTDIKSSYFGMFYIRILNGKGL